jgi:hypothetical protein
MPDRELSILTLLRPILSMQTDSHQGSSPADLTTMTAQRDPLNQVVCRLGDNSCAGAHAAALDRGSARQPARNAQSLLQLQRQYGNRYVQRVLRASRLEECPICLGGPGSPTASVEDRKRDILGEAADTLREVTDEPGPDVEALYSVNGTTTCVFPGGTASSNVTNSECSSPCTTRHEGVHAGDISPCCASAGTAYRAATTDADRESVRTRFFGWLGSNRAWFECRGYAESVRCADELLAAKNCNNPAPADAACCSHLASYRSSMESSRASNCASAGSLSACPFS